MISCQRTMRSTHLAKSWGLWIGWWPTPWIRCASFEILLALITYAFSRKICSSFPETLILWKISERWSVFIGPNLLLTIFCYAVSWHWRGISMLSSSFGWKYSVSLCYNAALIFEFFGRVYYTSNTAPQVSRDDESRRGIWGMSYLSWFIQMITNLLQISSY